MIEKKYQSVKSRTKVGLKSDTLPTLPTLPNQPNTTPQEEVYNYYSKTIKPGGKEDAIRNIIKLLKTVSKEELIGRIDAYKQSILKNKKQDPEYYIQANNFFGRAARYKEFEPIKKIEYKPVDPNCKLCKGQGHVYIADTGNTKVCSCRLTTH
jgi:hypothetical protein